MSNSPNIYVAVIDNEECVCRSMSRLLRAANFQPVTYLSAEAFLADTKHPRYDCLLLDVHLGGISGPELHKRLVAVKDTTPVIYMTAHDRDDVREEILDSGCAGYFHKTDPGLCLLDAIRKAVAERNVAA